MLSDILLQTPAIYNLGFYKHLWDKTLLTPISNTSQYLLKPIMRSITVSLPKFEKIGFNNISSPIFIAIHYFSFIFFLKKTHYIFRNIAYLVLVYYQKSLLLKFFFSEGGNVFTRFIIIHFKPVHLCILQFLNKFSIRISYWKSPLIIQIYSH